MSGVTGNKRIQSRKEYKEVQEKAQKLIKDFPGFVSCTPSGSFNSDKNKNSFGDIDLITHIEGSDKKIIKKQLAEYFSKMSDEDIEPFISEKYRGRKYYNSGEIITCSIMSRQVDFIIALTKEEAEFKKEFLDMPAEKQGLILGLVKVAVLENPSALSDILIPELKYNQELEFNLSSKEIQLRKVTYKPDEEFKAEKTEVIYRSTNFGELKSILNFIDTDLSFAELITEIKNKKFKSPRSLKRIKGVFKSMVSVKSGEIGKEKGINKQKSLDIVSSLGVHGIFSGRMQPLTKTHTEIFRTISNECSKGTVFLVKGKKTSQDKEKNPFDEEVQLKMIQLVLPDNMEVKIIKTGFFVEELNESEDSDFRIYAGSDRVESYKSYSKYMKEGTLEVKEIVRTDEDISATKVREALRDNNLEAFNLLTPEEIHPMFEELRELTS